MALLAHHGAAMRTAAALLVALIAAPCAAVETLQDLWRVAAARNPGMRAAHLEADAAWSMSQAEFAKLAPSVSVRTGYTVRSSEPSFVGSQPQLGLSSFRLPYAQEQAANFSARASVPLWTAGRLENSAAAAQRRHDATCESARWARMQLSMAVAEAYIQTLQAEAALKSARQRLQSDEAMAQDINLRSSQQQTTDQDVLEARVSVLEARQRVVRATNARQNAMGSLNQLLGRSLDHDCTLSEPSFPPLQSSLADLTEMALANRPDLIEISHRIRVHQRDADCWTAAQRPQVSAEVGFNYEENRFQSPEGIGTAGIVADWDAFDAGAKRRQSEAASRLASSMRAALRERQDEVGLEVLRAWNDLSEALHAEQVAAESLTLAIEHSRSVSKRFEQGVVVEADYEAASARLVESRAQLIYARTDRILRQIRLRFVAGLLCAE